MLGRIVFLLLVIISMVTFFKILGSHLSIFELHYKMVVEIVYTISLLTLVGWVIWWQIVENYSTPMKKRYVQWSVFFVTVQLFCLTYHIVDVMNGSFQSLHELPIQSFILLIMIVLGVPFLYKTYWFDTIWVFLFVICQQLQQDLFQSFQLFSIFILNSIHLITASIWVAGLTFLIIYWKRHEGYLQTYLPVFSEYTFFCLTVLTITGSVRASFYFTSVHDYFSHWGLLFLLKLLIVCMVVFISSIVRTTMKRGTSKYCILLNYCLMVLIIVIVIFLKSF